MDMGLGMETYPPGNKQEPPTWKCMNAWKNIHHPFDSKIKKKSPPEQPGLQLLAHNWTLAVAQKHGWFVCFFFFGSASVRNRIVWFGLV